jgi:hypothetical protein
VVLGVGQVLQHVLAINGRLGRVHRPVQVLEPDGMQLLRARQRELVPLGDERLEAGRRRRNGGQEAAKEGDGPLAVPPR